MCLKSANRSHKFLNSSSKKISLNLFTLKCSEPQVQQEVKETLAGYSHQISLLFLLFFTVISMITGYHVFINSKNEHNFKLEVFIASLGASFFWYFLKFSRFKLVSAYGGWILILIQNIFGLLASKNSLIFATVD